jgi:hypothetical protein
MIQSSHEQAEKKSLSSFRLLHPAPGFGAPAHFVNQGNKIIQFFIGSHTRERQFQIQTMIHFFRQRINDMLCFDEARLCLISIYFLTRNIVCFAVRLGDFRFVHVLIFASFDEKGQKLSPKLAMGK